MKHIILKITFYLLVACHVISTAHAQEILIDAVLASVDGKPLTLQDLTKRYPKAREMTLNQISSSPEIKTILDSMIMEKVIQYEAETRKLSVNNTEIDDYIGEVAKRNNLSREGFEAALVAEGKSIEEYKTVLKTDILKSKLTSSYVRGAVAVSNDEIDKYIDANPQLAKSGAKVKLSQILVATEGKSEEEALKKINEALAQIKSGKDFAEVAEKFSESSEAAEGGSLGIIAEEDLSSAISNAISTLTAGGVSDVVQTGVGFHIFKLNERLEERQKSENEDEDEAEEAEENAIREEVRKIIQNQKMQEKMNSFFTEEIFKLHSIDRKI